MKVRRKEKTQADKKTKDTRLLQQVINAFIKRMASESVYSGDF